MIIKEVEDSKTNDFTVSDVTEEEQQYLFKKGLSALVNEARKGKTQFIVVDPDHPVVKSLESPDPKKSLTVEIDDDDVDALIQVGITQILIDFIEAEKEEAGYWANLEKACKDAGEEWEVTNDDGTTTKVHHKMRE